jgi:hypothetical protein
MMQAKYCGKWAVSSFYLFIYSTLLLKDRFKALEVLLKEWRKDRTNKVLIFTKSVKLLEMLEFHLGAKRKTA